MMDAVKTALGSLGVTKAQIKTEAFGTVKRNPSAKAAASTEIAGSVLFKSSGTTSPVAVDSTILDAADLAGVQIDNACRSGMCGSCRMKLIKGQVTMEVEDALSDQDKVDGYILTCQAKVQGDVELDV